MNVLRKPGVLKKINVSKSTLDNWLDPKSKYYQKAFPKPFKLGVGVLGWDESEIDDWLEVKKAESRGQHPKLTLVASDFPAVEPSHLMQEAA